MRLLVLFLSGLFVGESGPIAHPPSLKPLSSCHCSYHQYPLPPNCTLGLLDDTPSSVGSVIIWRASSTSDSTVGMLGWEISITTSCWEGFWGDSDRRTLETSVMPWSYQIKPIDIALVESAPEETQIILFQNNSDIYSWGWLKEQVKTTRVVYGMRVKVHLGSHGEIIRPKGAWTHSGGSDYKSESRYLRILHTSEKNGCPVSKFKKAPALWTTPRKAWSLITVPSLSLQFSVILSPKKVLCIHEDQPVFETQGGYLITLLYSNGMSILWKPSQKPAGGAEPSSNNPKTHDADPDAWSTNQQALESMNPRSSLDYAALQGELGDLLSQENHQLQKIHREICNNKLTEWYTLRPPDLDQKIAQYVTGSVQVTGSYHKGGFKVCHLCDLRHPCQASNPLEEKLGWLSIVCGTSKLWMEPLTGRTSANPQASVFSLFSSHLPTLDNRYWDWTTNTFSETNRPSQLQPLIMPPAHNPDAMYSIRDLKKQEITAHLLLPNSIGTKSGPWYSNVWSRIPLTLSGIFALLLGFLILRLLWGCFCLIYSSFPFLPRSSQPNTYPPGLTNIH